MSPLSGNPGRRASDRTGTSVIAGLAAGVGATWIMTQFAALWLRAFHPPRSTNRSGGAVDRPALSQDDRATAAIAQAVGKRAAGRALTATELHALIPVIRYIYGAIAGGMYGWLADNVADGIAAGAAWGVVLWIAGDEIVLPALEPSDTRADGGRAEAIAAHLVYGIATDAIWRRVRALNNPAGA